jgi:hypothetical protein
MNRIDMKSYLAHFVSESEMFTVKTDGISHVHAHARAWLKFMQSGKYKNNKDGWELDSLLDLTSDTPDENVDPFQTNPQNGVTPDKVKWADESV